jgi:hypothetical protein
LVLFHAFIDSFESGFVGYRAVILLNTIRCQKIMLVLQAFFAFKIKTLPLVEQKVAFFPPFPYK